MQASPTNPSQRQENIWEFFQNEYPESFAGSYSRIHYLVKQIAPRSTVLNIGCGTGIFEEIALRSGLDTYSLDPSERSIDNLKHRLGLGERARVGYIQEIPFADDFFDAVVVSEVFEHLPDDILARGVAEIKRILKPAGRLLGTVPSHEDLRLQYVVCPCCNQKFHRWGHEQSFDLEKIHKLLSAHFPERSAFSRPFFAWKTLNFKGKIVAGAKWVLWKMGSHGASENIVFSASKAG